MKTLRAATFILLLPITWAGLITNVHQELNSMVHQTSNYSISANDLVLRRGRPFVLTFKVPSTDEYFDFDIEITDRYASDVKSIKIIPVESFDSFEPKSPTEWPAIITQPDPETTDIQCLIPSNAPIDRYSIVTKYDGGKKSLVSKIYVIFDAWNVNDAAHVSSQVLRDKFISSTSGKIYLNLEWEESIDWDFSTFDQETLMATFELLSKHPELNLAGRSDPVVVSAALSMMATNGTSEHGLVEVNWSREKKDYNDGHHPMDFKSSKNVFELYLKTNSPVKYANSWTVAALVTSMLRSVGMAARVVSADKVGYDGNNNLLIDRCMDERRLVFTDSPLCQSDFVLNQHAWTEVWMARRDLVLTHPYYTFPEWQVIDATVGYVDGYFKSHFGPSPVAAVRNGDVSVPFNTSLAFAMITSPKVLWIVNSVTKQTQEATRVTLDETAPVVAYDDQNDLRDITNRYKSLKLNFRRVALNRGLNQVGTDTSVIDEVFLEESLRSAIVEYELVLENFHD